MRLFLGCLLGGATLNNDALVCLFEPLLRILLRDAVVDSNDSLFSPLHTGADTRTRKNDVEIHAIDTGVGIVLEAEIDVLLNTKAKVACNHIRNSAKRFTLTSPLSRFTLTFSHTTHTHPLRNYSCFAKVKEYLLS